MRVIVCTALLAALLVCAAAHTSAGKDEEALVAWVEELGGRVGSVEIQMAGPLGRALVATADIAKGEEIAVVPAQAMLTFHALMEDETVGYMLSSRRVSRTDAMALFVLYQRSLGARSPWAPWIATLPHAFDTTLFWSDAELDMLQASSLGVFARRRNRGVVRAYERVVRDWLLVEHADVWGEVECTLEDFFWALSVVWSRTFGVNTPDSERTEAGFTPLADMANYHGPDEVNVAETMTRGTLRLAAARRIRRGQEVVVQYSHDIANQQLLMDYGFTLEENDDDVVFASLPRFDTGSRHHPLRMELAEETGVDRVDTLQLSAAAPLPPPLLAVYRLAHVTAAERDAFVDSVRTGGPVSKSNERRALKHAAADLHAQLASFATTLADDEARLAGGAVRGRELHALRVRVSEKRILTAAIAAVDARRAANAPAARTRPLSGGEAAKGKKGRASKARHAAAKARAARRQRDEL